MRLVNIIELVKQYMNEDVTLSEFKDMYINNNVFFQDTIDIIKHLKELGYKVCLLSNLKEIDDEKFCGQAFFSAILQ